MFIYKYVVFLINYAIPAPVAAPLMNDLKQDTISPDLTALSAPLTAAPEILPASSLPAISIEPCPNNPPITKQNIPSASLCLSLGSTFDGKKIPTIFSTNPIKK